MRLKKSLGQHFLKDKSVVRRIADALGVFEDDCVVEIGGGGGALTEELIKRNPKELVVVEIDPEWCEYLSSKFENLKVINADAVEFNFSSLGSKWKFAGNLPYNVSTAILRNLLDHRKVFEKGVFMVQKEVADRLTASSGKDYGYLPALLSNFFSFKKLFDVPPGAFQPPPKVMSTVFLMEPKSFDMRKEELLEFERFLKKAFSHRRKKLKKNLGLKKFTGTEEVKSLIDKRAEEIPPRELLELFRELKLLGYSF